MKHAAVVTACAIALLTAFTACIKDAEPNIEVDILDVLTDSEGVLNVVQQAGMIDIYTAPYIDPEELSFGFVLSEGASISPDPSTVTGYASPRTFTVTSEDRQWSKDYTVRVRLNEIPTSFGFEHWVQPAQMKYMIPVAPAIGTDAEMYIWASGNEPYNFLASKDKDYTFFPTQPSNDSHTGAFAAMLVTKTTPELSKPIASGSLFIGQFDASEIEPKNSTMFGLPFFRKPLRLHGWYKYKSGGKTHKTGIDDMGRMQCVLYRTDDNVRYLNGFTLNTSPNVVARAEATVSDTPGNNYVEFDLPLTYYADLDPDLLARGGYSISVIFSSSRYGDDYDGAPGSTMYVDDVEIICDDTTSSNAL